MAHHYLLYGHGGSYNHGSEASVRCDIALLRSNFPGCRITLASHFPEQDLQFGLDADEIVGRDLSGRTDEEVYAAAIQRITPETVCLSVGGDMYCYPNWQRYAAIHYAALAQGAKSILWSCSVDPSTLDEEMLCALRTHHLITVREEISLRILRNLGLTNVVKVSDIAFLLAPKPTFCGVNSDYVVLNLSPLVVRRNAKVLDAYQSLMQYILEQTCWNIVLLSHVSAKADNDCEALRLLYRNNERIWMTPLELAAAELKFILSKARFCVASRTHACVAAYAAQVPTLAVGYSVKSAGIAADLGQSKFVLDADTLDTEVLLAAFKNLVAEEADIHAQLELVMSGYIKGTISPQILGALR